MPSACFSASVKAVDLSLPIECCASCLSIHVGGDATDALGILPLHVRGIFLYPTWKGGLYSLSRELQLTGSSFSPKETMDRLEAEIRAKGIEIGV